MKGLTVCKINRFKVFIVDRSELLVKKCYHQIVLSIWQALPPLLMYIFSALRYSKVN